MSQSQITNINIELTNKCGYNALIARPPRRLMVQITFPKSS